MTAINILIVTDDERDFYGSVPIASWRIVHRRTMVSSDEVGTEMRFNTPYDVVILSEQLSHTRTTRVVALLRQALPDAVILAPEGEVNPYSKSPVVRTWKRPLSAATLLSALVETGQFELAIVSANGSHSHSLGNHH